VAGAKAARGVIAFSLSGTIFHLGCRLHHGPKRGPLRPSANELQAFTFEALDFGLGPAQ